jgi:hypothetical protein
MKHLFAALVIVAAAAPLRADLAEGNWRLAQMVNASVDSSICVLKVEKKDGKLTAEVADRPAKSEVKLDGFEAKGDRVLIVVDFGGTKRTFEGTVDAKDPKTVRGTFGDDMRVTRAVLVAQDADKMPTPAELAAARPKAPEPFADAQKLQSAPLTLRFRAQQSKDVNDKADLLEKAKEAQKVADEKVPGLLRETFDKHGEAPQAVDAAAQLVRTAMKIKASPQDAEKWVKRIDEDAAKYGPRYVRDTHVLNAEVLRPQKGMETLALANARAANDATKETDPQAFQERVLRVLKATQMAAGKADDAKATEARLVKVSAALDAEYAKTVPPFQPEKFAGRTEKAANRVAVMELFTGAQCPPCVAADVAFDALSRAYRPADLILIQYHVHIPGPDPLTTEDTVERMSYYSKLAPREVGGTPSTVFNGKPQSLRGGGPMSVAEEKFGQYRKVINALLEESTDVKVAGSARRDGDKVTITAETAGAKGGDDVVFRLILLEEQIQYVGGNGLRVHHDVVRGFPNGRKGTAIKDGSAKAVVEVNLAELRTSLAAYLDKFGADQPFPYEDRPMDLGHLKVVALVQNDATGEILNAVQFPVEGK